MTGEPPPPADPEPAGGPGDLANDVAFREALDHGTPVPLDVYRRVYATVGLPWPGEEEVRRRHRVTHDGDDGDGDGVPASVCQMVWPEHATEPAERARTWAREALAEARARWTPQRWDRLRAQLGLAPPPAGPDDDTSRVADATGIADDVIRGAGNAQDARARSGDAGCGSETIAEAYESGCHDALHEAARDGAHDVKALHRDVTWLRRAVQALLDHSGISLGGHDHGQRHRSRGGRS
jgi:hypothetical protein